jgi:succinyl-diaminopimelate desuccinylase
VIYGPGRLTVAHSYNEYVEVSDLANTYAVIRGAAARYLGLRLAP